MDQKQFLFVTDNNDYLSHKSLTKQFFEKLVKGFSLQAEIKFELDEALSATGRIIKVRKNKLLKVIEDLKPEFIGVEGPNSWQYIYNADENPYYPAIISPGINLNLAVILHNYRRVINVPGAQKRMIALHNVENEYGQLIAGIFSAIIGDIVLVGNDSQELKKMAKQFFNEYGVMTLTSNQPYTRNNCINIDTLSLLSYVAKMNYVGEYKLLEGKEICSSVFSAPLVETLLIAANVMDRKKYFPTIINVTNVLAVSKSAKKAGFFPLFSTVQT